MPRNPNTEDAQDASSSAGSSNSESAARHKPLYVNLLRWSLLVLLPVLIYPLFVLPALQQRRLVTCQSNLKQIALGYKQYIRDNDEQFPLIYSDNDGNGRFDSARDMGWAQSIQPYVKSVRVMQCPNEGRPANLAGGPQIGFTDYFYNRKLSAVNEATLTHVSNTVELGDHQSCDPSCNIAGTAELDAGATVRHLKGANYAFVDGHVKWLKPGVLADGRVTAKNLSFQIK